MIFRWVGWLVRLLLAPLLGVWVLLRRRVPAQTWLRLEVDGDVVSFERPRRPFLSLRGFRAPLSLADLESLGREVVGEPRVRGLLVVLHDLRAGMATCAALRRALTRFREVTQREVVVYLPNGADTKQLYVASAATKVVVAPRSSVAPVGFVASARYAKRALDRLGISAERLAIGAYKSAGETLERDHMSEAQREQLDALLDTFYAELVDALASGRSLEPARVQALVDRAPFTANEARSEGLVDHVAYEDELGALLGSDAAFRPAGSFLAARRARVLPRLTHPAVIAVLPLEGTITSGVGPLDMAERFAAAAERLRRDTRVRGVLLHVDSPGGGALASDRMHHEVERLAQAKPVVAHFGDVAASGGYYVGVAAHHIVAEPTTITGSIGVVAARVVVEPLLERLGVVTERLQRGAHAALLDPLHRPNESERSALEREIQHVYEGFLEVVGAGRKRSRDEVHAVAQGRVWSGRDALAHGLVDELGDATTALAALRQRIGPTATKLPVVMVRAPLVRPRLLRGLATLALGRERVLLFATLDV